MSIHTIEVNAGNFQQLVIEASQRAPVLVDFWAPWCAPCRALAPVLEKLAAEYEGKFTLAKVNSDENQALATEFGVRGIPNVKAFVNGQIADEFSGALPEPMVREFLERNIPSRAEELRRQAMEDYANEHDAKQALVLLEEAAQADPRNEAVRLDTAEVLIDLGRFDQARKVLDSISPLVKMDERAAELAAKLQFAASAADATDAESLQARIARNPEDFEARLQLANLSVAKKDYAAALEQLLEVVRRDRKFNDDIARKTMLQVFNLLGNQGDLVSDYRRKLASAMN
jgi:putative thioredoxin